MKIPYLRVLFSILILGLVFLVDTQTHYIEALLLHSSDPHLVETFFIISVIFILSFTVFYIARLVSIPSFVIAIFFGMAAKNLLAPITGEVALAGQLVGLGATFILFGGGLETPWQNFRKLAAKILSLSFIGLLITSFLFSVIIWWLGTVLNINIPVPVAVLLGAVLASTDPAAIIPVLKQLRFNNRDTKDLVISESAVTDVTGTLLTIVFLGLIGAGVIFGDVVGSYGLLFSGATGLILLKQIFFGLVFGVLGFGLLEIFNKFKRGHEQEHEADATYFFSIPILIFTGAIIFGGSGYLAAFIAGLLFVFTQHLHETEKFFNQTVEGFLKPMIFILLGALVDVDALLDYAVVGIIAALVFMFVIRPIAVFISLGPFSLIGKNRLNLRELLFVSFVRETGAIPAVLLVTIVSLGITGLDGLVPIGMWVILATLIIQPPLTPLIAKLLKVGEKIIDKKPIIIDRETKPYVVLGSRGNSFILRLPFVSDWADQHEISKVLVLHCLEDKYTPELAAEIEQRAKDEFAKINQQRKTVGKEALEYSIMSRKGFLQNNIDEIAKGAVNPSAIFVGKKILDFRLEQIKQLNTPLYFLD